MRYNYPYQDSAELTFTMIKRLYHSHPLPLTKKVHKITSKESIGGGNLRENAANKGLITVLSFNSRSPDDFFYDVEEITKR